ncbi:MAG TPA: 30S ribosomal protein S9 [Candidatus Acidoferrum sp.]|nr:30S ribosomal protein S9 [Candidatus Acidoferrum sp.]
MEGTVTQMVEAQKPAQPAVQAEQPKAQRQKRAAAPRKRVAKKAEKIILVKSRRKSAIARASAKAGSGRIRINGHDVSAMEHSVYKDAVQEPVKLSSITKELAGRLEIEINVKGGGSSGQSQAIRSAIAKAISKFSETDTIRKEYMRYDRSLLVDDYRRTEPKKFRGPKARARFQTSYR